jgi:hypothetical protein
LTAFRKKEKKPFASRGALILGNVQVIPKKKLSEMKQMLGIAAVLMMMILSRKKNTGENKCCFSVIIITV